MCLCLFDVQLKKEEQEKNADTSFCNNYAIIQVECTNVIWEKRGRYKTQLSTANKKGKIVVYGGEKSIQIFKRDDKLKQTHSESHVEVQRSDSSEHKIRNALFCFCFWFFNFEKGLGTKVR